MSVDNIPKTLKRQVLREANNLKKYATKAELNRLCSSLIDGDSPYDCIYGQMTGYCFSDRANELVTKCGVPVSHSITLSGLYPVSYWKKDGWGLDSFLVMLGRRDFSAIEKYITYPKAKIGKLVSYLKGKTLVLDI